jgi:hypothetical protein
VNDHAGKPPVSVLVGLVILQVVILLISLSQIRMLRGMGDALSETADPWTESDTVRAAEGYARLGFLANWGLPDLCFGEQFAHIGTKGMLLDDATQAQNWTDVVVGRGVAKVVNSDHFVYTHYPPGPYLIAGAMTAGFGTGRIHVYRLVPVTIGLIAIIYLLGEMAASVGPLRAGLGALALAIVPMFTDMMHGLAYQGYALSFLLVQFGLCLRIARQGSLTTWMITALVLISFVQGALGFDYVFLVTFAPLVVSLVMEDDRPGDWGRRVVTSCGLTCSGFLFATGLHFLQVAGYFGSVRLALQDYVGIAAYRANGATYDNGASVPSRLRVLWDYLTVHTALPMHFGFSVLWFVIGVFVVLLVIKLFGLAQVTWAALVSLPVALLIASLWVVAMPQHSAQHFHFIPRHYFVAVFIPILTLLKIREHRGAEPVASPTVPPRDVRQGGKKERHRRVRGASR